ncbi:CutC family protein [Pyronema domesticum]|uniref:Copper homeostasis protein cutC homolog n=1 Tax=Pyronema omphalodes (strain CBS 100304) TaxID=1076935 RepID=U4L8A9_PYROM|nr:CutC family protein [Pyronema domesticum]CCX13082.1 Similar to Copper homeostasis protein CutC; acc. no. A6UF02 [Pyronema omphalodes CBS 100304]
MAYMPPLLEVCVDNLTDLNSAIDGGADRIELCSSLSVGGLTPTYGLMRHASRLQIPVYAMIRPRNGSFVYSEPEVDMMLAEIGHIINNQDLEGVVLGANLDDGTLDRATLSKLTERAKDCGLRMTLHRAFDLVPDSMVEKEVEFAIQAGFERILSSGGERTAIAGENRLRRMVAAAKGRIEIMPGAGITLENVKDVVKIADFEWIHSSCSESLWSEEGQLRKLGFVDDKVRFTSKAVVSRMKAALKNL